MPERAIITSDLHLTDNPRDSYRHDFMEFTLPRLLDAADSLYVLGDLTEQKDHHGSQLVNRIVGHFHALAKLVERIYILCGNHDYTVANYPFFQFLQRLDRKIFWLQRGEVHGPWMIMPHTDNWEKDWLGVNWPEYTTLLCHQTFAGARVGKRTFDGIPTSIFPRDNFHVYSGDIHTPQTFGCVTYVGAPYTIDFGDNYKPRVLYTVDYRVRKSIPVPGPQKRLLDLKIGDRFPSNPFQPNDIVKVRVAVTASQKENWPTAKARIYEWADEKGYVLWQVQPTLDPADRRRMRTAIKTSDRAVSDAELVRAYAKLAKISDRILKTGLWIMEQQ